MISGHEEEDGIDGDGEYPYGEKVVRMTLAKERDRRS
jgi:hypothetical protein